MKLTSALLFAMHTILSFGKLQLEIDILAAGIVQDYHSVIGGAFLLRPHPLDGGTALFQKVAAIFRVISLRRLVQKRSFFHMTN